MRAKFVRGQDPKSAMGIGKIQEIKAEWEKFYKGDTEWDLDKALIWSIEYGVDEYIEILIKAGANVNYKNGEPLFWAVMYKKPEIIKLLIRNGANINARNGKIFKWAVNSNNIPIIKIFTDYPNLEDQYIKDAINDIRDEPHRIEVYKYLKEEDMYRKSLISKLKKKFR